MKQTICQFLGIKLDQYKPFIIKYNGCEVYIEYANGYWYKRIYDAYGNLIYYENSYGLRGRKEYDSDRNLIYSENSYGDILDNRYKELTLDEIADKFGIPVEHLKLVAY